MIKVLVVDDHEMMRKGISLVFELEDGFELVGEACDGVEALEKAAETAPDVILMDIRMPRKSGIQAAREIKKMRPLTKIMMLTAVNEEEDIMQAIETGVDGYTLKNISGSELTDAVRAVAAGQSYLHPAVARKALLKLGKKRVEPQPSAPPLLTARESLVLRFMAEGRKNKEIAVELFLSEETIKSHVSHILNKLNQADRMQAVLYALRNNLVTLDDEDTGVVS